MNRYVLIAALVVIGSLPLVAAQPVAVNGDEEPAIESTYPSEQRTATGSSGGSSAATASDDGHAADGNYTRLYVDSERGHLELKPGESDSFTITVKNAEDSAVTVDPHLHTAPLDEQMLEDSWVAIEGDTTVAAGEEAEFEVTVTVPEDAETGYYTGQIAFTDETIAYPGRPARPVHAEHVRVRVWKEPTVTILSRTYLHGQVEAGDSVTKQIVIKNDGDKPVPLSPESQSERYRCHGECPGQIDPSWIDIDAPNEIAPGDTATVSITISPPADAERGRYRGGLDLGLKDPNRDERRSYWQEVNLNVVVWSQPESPFETTFEVSEQAQNVTLTLSPRSERPYHDGESSDADPARFDVEFVAPDGTVIEAKRVRVSDSGFVDLGSEERPTAQMSDGEYVVRGGQTEFVYRVDDPAAGSWTARVMPHNTMGFGYEITRNESAE